MLEGLDQIDWSRLSHAYGDASDVPDLIRALAAGSVENSREALHELFGNIWHQGTVYQATAVAVPFLLELVEDPATPERSGILHLLQSISEGWLACQRYAAEEGRFVPPEVAARHAKERPHYQAAHEEAAKGFDVLVRLLSDEDRAVRAGSAFVLATLTERSSDVATTLLDTIDDETDDWCRGALLLALLVLVQNAARPAIADVAVPRFESVLEETDSPFAALGAGIALLHLNHTTAVPRVLELARPRLVKDRERLANIPWEHATELYSLVDESLSGMPRQRLRWIIEGLTDADQQVRLSAMYSGGELCAELRWGPAELAPYYANLLNSADSEERKLAVRRLGGMGAIGVDYLQSIVNHPSAAVRADVTEQLQRIVNKQKERESWLVERRPFFLPSVISLLRTIDRHQASRKWDDEQKVCDAVIHLGFHGARAAPAVEQLKQLTGRDSPWIRVHAIRSLWKITHDPSLVVPLLQASLRPEPVAFLVLDCLKQIGLAAGTLIPELRRILHSEERYFKSWGDDACALDEAFCEASAETMRAIETQP